VFERSPPPRLTELKKTIRSFYKALLAIIPDATVATGNLRLGKAILVISH
jgi:hypothetical protein